MKLIMKDQSSYWKVRMRRMLALSAIQTSQECWQYHGQLHCQCGIWQLAQKQEDDSWWTSYWACWMHGQYNEQQRHCRDAYILLTSHPMMQLSSNQSTSKYQWWAQRSIIMTTESCTQSVLMSISSSSSTFASTAVAIVDLWGILWSVRVGLV